MIPRKPATGKFRYRMIGGGLQLHIKSAADIAGVLELDEAHWAMTGIDADSLRFDRRFLDFVDSDHDGKIRSDEVKSAVRFLLASFRDLSGTEAGSPQLSVSSLDPDAPDMAAVISCAGLLLDKLGKAPGDTLSAADIRAAGAVTSFACRNGDGVITAENDLAPDTAELINAVIASGRKSIDRSGKEGISLTDLENFESALARKLDLLKRKDEDPAIFIYGGETPEAYRILTECETLLDGYFLNSAAGEFLLHEPERIVRKEFSADLMMPETVREALSHAAAAVPGKERGVLDFSAPLNPLYAAKLRELAASPAVKDMLVGTTLSEAAYQQAKALLEPYGEWEKAMAESDGLEKFSPGELAALAKISTAETRELIVSDLSFDPVVGAGETLLKLALFQEYMVEFLNNFVSLAELFNPAAPSRLQMGKLVMDGRHFTLTVKVKNPVEHKKIIAGSNICVIYVEVSRLGGAEKQLLAAAVTGGTMRSLFVGKHGVFFDTDGVVYDAVIKDIAEQPVSIGEAFRAPFYRFADFLGKQTEKIFNTRNAEVQKSMTAEMNKSALAKVPAVNAPAVNAPAVPAAGNNNLSMLLVSGGIGIAALGSSVAFIANSLQGVSFRMVLSVILGIVIIFGGPSVVIALIKLFRRNLSRFLESCGCAVNRPMRMSRKMGAIFTFVPRRPKGELSLNDPVDLFDPVRKRSFLAVVLALLLGCALGTAVAWWHHSLLDRSESAVAENPAPAENKKNECVKTAVAEKVPSADLKKVK